MSRPSVNPQGMKIDMHTHIVPEKMPRFADRFGYGGFIEIRHQANCRASMVYDDGRHFRDIADNCWNPARRIEDAARQGVSLQVLSTVPVLFGYWVKPEDALVVSQFLNDHIAETVARFPLNFLGLGTVPLQAPELAARELERCVTQLGLKGVEIGTHVNGMGLDDSRLTPFFETAERLGTAIFIHPWDMLGGERMKKYWLGWLVGMPTETALAISQLSLGGIFRRFPRIRFAFAHGGGSFSAIVGRLAAGHSARPDLVATDTPENPATWLGHFFVDSIVHSSQALRHAIEVFGANRILLGSDYPFPLGESQPGNLIESMTELDNTTREKLLFRNAEEWLGLK